MPQTSQDACPNIFPGLRYEDAMAAIDWLERAFGFARGLVVAGDDGTVHHAQLSLGPGWIMLGSVRDDVLRMKSPRQLGAVNQSIYVAIADPDAHYARAQAAGAEIVRELADTDYGSREYTCRDLEGTSGASAPTGRRWRSRGAGFTSVLPSPIRKPMSNPGRPMARIGEPTPEVGRPAADVDRAMSNVGEPMSNLGRAAGKLRRPVFNVGRSTANVGRSMSNVRGAMSKLRRPLSNAGGSTSNVGRPLSNAGEPPANVGGRWRTGGRESAAPPYSPPKESDRSGRLRGQVGGLPEVELAESRVESAPFQTALDPENDGLREAELGVLLVAALRVDVERGTTRDPPVVPISMDTAVNIKRDLELF